MVEPKYSNFSSIYRNFSYSHKIIQHSTLRFGIKLPRSSSEIIWKTKRFASETQRIVLSTFMKLGEVLISSADVTDTKTVMQNLLKMYYFLTNHSGGL